MRVAVVLGLGLLMLTACDDPKEASESNFKQAINAYFAKHPSCIYVPAGSTLSLGQQRDPSGFPIYYELQAHASPFRRRQRADTQGVDALVSAGLLSAQEIAIPYRGLFNNNTTLPVNSYDLTDKGRQALSTTENDPLGSGVFRNRFCYGTPEVVQVVHFTEPTSNLRGMTVSRVIFTYRLKNRAEWAMNPSILAAFPELKKSTADSVKDDAELVLTNNGWVHFRDFREAGSS